jgi:hypothetical protein
MFVIADPNTSGSSQAHPNNGWLASWRPQCHSGCHQPSVQSSPWRRHTTGIRQLIVSAVPSSGGIFGDLESRLRDTALRSVDASTRSAYSSAWVRFLRFAKIYGFNPTAPYGITWPEIFQAFLLHSVEDDIIPVTPDRADQCVSGILKFLESLAVYPERAIARSPIYISVRTALKNEYLAKTPKRLRERIPFTIPLILQAFAYIDLNIASPHERRLLKVLFAAGHAFSLRPGEYTRTSPPYHPNRYLCAATTFAWFHGIPYSALQASSWPSFPPSHICSLLDVRKNSKDQGAPVAVTANPSPNRNSFCCVRILTDYIRHTSFNAQLALFHRDGVHADADTLSMIMKTVATQAGLDPTRVSPVCLRRNVITQMDLSTPELLRHLQGGWRSNAGEEHYWAQLLQVADANQSAVHNAGSATIEVLRTIFDTAGNGTILQC